MATVTVACSNQGGLIIGTDAQNNPIILAGPPAPANGLNPGHGNAGFGFTEVDEAVWNGWLATYETRPLITGGAVWKVT